MFQAPWPDSHINGVELSRYILWRYRFFGDQRCVVRCAIMQARKARDTKWLIPAINLSYLGSGDSTDMLPECQVLPPAP